MSRGLLPLLLLSALSCADSERIPLHFDGPVATAWLPASEHLPFMRPVGFAANSRSGTIIPLDLIEGRILTDDSAASWLRASAIATGQARQLADLAAFASYGRITLWTIDIASGELLQVPYVTGVGDDGSPTEVVPEAGEALFVDADGSGDEPTLSDIVVRAGFTTTEDWSIEYDGTRWWAVGSRSGKQEAEPVSGRAFLSDHAELGFTLAGSATAGDRFEIHTDTGVVAWSFEGGVNAILGSVSRLFVSVGGADPSVMVIDPWTGATLGRVPLPAGASPWRMARASDGRLFVADAKSPAVYLLGAEVETDPSLAAVQALSTAAPLIDVAWSAGEGEGDTPFERLFVAPVGLLRVDVYDLVEGEWVDPNPEDDEVAGVNLGSPISGISASIGDVWLQQATPWGALPRVPTIAVATQDGFVFQIDASTGCGVVSERGPHGPNEILDASNTQFAYSYLEDQGEASGSELVVDAATGEQIAVSPCGGVARGESWTVTYDSANVSWEVEGSLSGVQENRAHDDERYVSDSGAISFLIASGSAPATDGDRFSFTIERGLLSMAGIDKDQDGVIGNSDQPWEAPGRPLAYEVTVGPTGGGWDPTHRREYALLPVENSDVVARLHLDAGVSQVGWE